MGTQDICLAVGRTEGADYSRWGSQPPPSDHPGHGTAGSFHASKLSADTSPHGSSVLDQREELWEGVGSVDINQRQLQPEQRLPASPQFGVNPDTCHASAAKPLRRGGKGPP